MRCEQWVLPHLSALSARWLTKHAVFPSCAWLTSWAITLISLIVCVTALRCVCVCSFPCLLPLVALLIVLLIHALLCLSCGWLCCLWLASSFCPSAHWTAHWSGCADLVILLIALLIALCCSFIHGVVYCSDFITDLIWRFSSLSLPLLSTFYTLAANSDKYNYMYTYVLPITHPNC